MNKIAALTVGLCLTTAAPHAENAPNDTASGTSLSDLSLDEINRRLDNPLTDIWSLTFQENLSLLEGDAIADTEVQSVTFFQPFMPFVVGKDNGYMFTVRPVFPLVSAPVIDPAQESGTNGRETGLGDIQLLTLAGPNRQSGAVWGVGGTFRFPTASDDALGAGKYQAGPALMAFYIGKPWVTGILAQHWWSFAGDNDRDSVSQSEIQYVIRHNFPGGWSLGMGPNATIDWKAERGERLTLPIGLGITKTVRWNGRPWKLRFEPQYSVIRPDTFGVEWNFRIQIAPIVDSPLR